MYIQINTHRETLCIFNSTNKERFCVDSVTPRYKDFVYVQDTDTNNAHVDEIDKVRVFVCRT